MLNHPHPVIYHYHLSNQFFPRGVCVHYRIGAASACFKPLLSNGTNENLHWFLATSNTLNIKPTVVNNKS